MSSPFLDKYSTQHLLNRKLENLDSLIRTCEGTENTSRATFILHRPMNREKAFKLYCISQRLYWQEFRPKDALLVCEKAFQLDPTNLDIRCALTNMLRYMGRFKDAKTVIDGALDENPEFLKALYTKCRLFHEGEPGDLSKRLLQKTENLMERLESSKDPKANEITLCFSRILTLSAFKQYEKCLRLCDDFLDRSEIASILQDTSLTASLTQIMGFEVCFRKAACIWEIFDPDHTISYLTQMLSSLKLPPVQHILLLWQRGRIFQSIGRYSDSVSDFRAALRKSEHREHRIACIVTIASLEQAQSQNVAALGILDDAIQAFPDAPRLYESKARIMRKSDFDISNIIDTLCIARELYRVHFNESIPSHRLQCLKFLVQCLMMFPSHAVSVGNVLEEIAEIALDSQRSFTEALGCMEFVYHFAHSLGIVECITNVVRKFIDREGISEQLYALCGNWMIRLGYEDKGFEYLRISAEKSIGVRDRNFYYLRTFVSKLIAKQRYKEAWEVLHSNVKEEDILLDDHLRLCAARVALLLKEFRICQNLLNHRNKVFETVSLLPEFGKLRTTLFRDSKVPSSVEQRIKQCISFADTKSELDSLSEFLMGNQLQDCILDEEGTTPLMEFVKHCNFHGVRMICNMGANVNHIDRNGNTPAGLASLQPNSDIAIFLISRGAFSEDVFMYTDLGRDQLSDDEGVLFNKDKFFMDDIGLSVAQNMHQFNHLSFIVRMGEKERELRNTSFRYFIRDQIMQSHSINVGDSVPLLIHKYAGQLPSDADIAIAPNLCSRFSR